MDHVDAVIAAQPSAADVILPNELDDAAVPAQRELPLGGPDVATNANVEKLETQAPPSAERMVTASPGCLPKPADGRQDASLRPTVLYAGDVPFGGDLHNFGHCAVDDAGVATLSLHDAKGATLYQVVLPPTINAKANTLSV